MDDTIPTLSEVKGDLTQIGEEMGTEGLALVATLMERNAREHDKLQASLYEGEKAAHEETKRRLRDTEHELSRVRFNIDCLLWGDPFNFDGRHAQGD